MESAHVIAIHHVNRRWFTAANQLVRMGTAWLIRNQQRGPGAEIAVATRQGGFVVRGPEIQHLQGRTGFYPAHAVLGCPVPVAIARRGVDVAAGVGCPASSSSPDSARIS